MPSICNMYEKESHLCVTGKFCCDGYPENA